MDNRVAEFVGPIRGEIGRAIYVWGGNGEIVTSEQQIRNAETSVANAERAIDLYRKRLAAGISPIRKMDCSGMLVWILRIMGLLGPSQDMTANMFSRICPTIPKADLRVGDFVFNLDDEGEAFHIGVVTRIESGVVYITEARGRDYGVVERPISAGYWDDWSHNPYINTEESFMKKGDKGENVTLWQTNLLAAGFKMTGTDGTEYTADGNFGGATERATIAFQLAVGLPGSGVVGDLTWAAMVKALTDKIAAALAEEAQRAAMLVDQIKIERDKNASLVTEAVAAKAAQLAAEVFAEKCQSDLGALNCRVDKIRQGRDALAML